MGQMPKLGVLDPVPNGPTRRAIKSIIRESHRSDSCDEERRGCAFGHNGPAMGPPLGDEVTTRCFAVQRISR